MTDDFKENDKNDITAILFTAVIVTAHMTLITMLSY
jgi:hypothetical protein